MLIQADTPPLPWWVLYVAVLVLAYGTWRLTVLRWWGGCLTAVTGWAMLFFIAALTIPERRMGLILALPFIPALAWLVGMARHRASSPVVTALGARFGGAAARQLPPGAMQGQPSPRAVFRAKVMEARFAAGMPRNAAFVARMRYVEGIGDLAARTADLFVGDGRLWVAPLTGEPLAIPIPARDVLRVDVWPELEGPPTLRVNYSPPGAATGTRDLVLATMPGVPASLVTPQLQAVAAVLQGLLRAEEQAAQLAADTPVTGVPAFHACPRCREAIPPGATACPRCALPV